MHGGRRLQTCATGEWAQRSCSGFESRYRNCPTTLGGRRLQTCATGEWAQRSCRILKVVTESACNTRRPQVTNLRYGGMGTTLLSDFESRHRNCPATHGDRRLQTCATGEWAQRSCRILKVVTGTGLQHTTVAGCEPALPGNGYNAHVVDLKVVTGTAPQRTATAGYKPALPGNETCEMTCARYSYEH